MTLCFEPPQALLQLCEVGLQVGSHLGFTRWRVGIEILHAGNLEPFLGGQCREVLFQSLDGQLSALGGDGKTRR